MSQELISAQDEARIVDNARRALRKSIAYDLAALLLGPKEARLAERLAQQVTRSVREDVRHEVEGLNYEVQKSRRPTLSDPPQSELVDAVRQYCATPRKTTELRLEINEYVRVSSWEMVSLIDRLEQQGIIKDTGTPQRRQWVAGPRKRMGLRPVPPPER
jgi:hypothetical protein